MTKKRTYVPMSDIGQIWDDNYWVDAEEAAAILGISEVELTELHVIGKAPPATSQGGRYRYDRSWLPHYRWLLTGKLEDSD